MSIESSLSCLSGSTVESICKRILYLNLLFERSVCRQTDESLIGVRDGKNPHNTTMEAARGTVINVNAEAPLKLRTVPVTTGKTARNRQAQLLEMNQISIKRTSAKTSKCIAKNDLGQSAREDRKHYSHQSHCNHMHFSWQDIIRYPQDAREYGSIKKSDERCSNRILYVRFHYPDKDL